VGCKREVLNNALNCFFTTVLVDGADEGFEGRGDHLGGCRAFGTRVSDD
jgi:hypothetical protein